MTKATFRTGPAKRTVRRQSTFSAGTRIHSSPAIGSPCNCTHPNSRAMSVASKRSCLPMARRYWIVREGTGECYQDTDCKQSEQVCRDEGYRNEKSAERVCRLFRRGDACFVMCVRPELSKTKFWRS